MKVFISWSGETSKAIAEILRDWLPSVIQAVKPYYSPDDITKGSRWSTEIAKELEECKVGLLCLTPDNLEAPWLMFEAGALSKSLTSARVCPLLFGIEPSDIKGPLVQFQAAPFTKEEMKKAVKMMNQELGAAALAGDVVDDVFEMWWPRIDEGVKKILSTVQTPGKQKVRSERDILDEILERVRAAPSLSDRERIHPGSVRDLMDGYRSLIRDAVQFSGDLRGDFLILLEQLWAPIDYIAHKTGVQSDRQDELRSLIHLLDNEIKSRDVFPEKPQILAETPKAKAKRIASRSASINR
jgi:hypothetical protein